MSSARSQALSDLERDLPTTRDDVEALRRLRTPRPSAAFAELQTLVDQLPPAARRPRRSTAAGWPELEL